MCFCLVNKNIEDYADRVISPEIARCFQLKLISESDFKPNFEIGRPGFVVLSYGTEQHYKANARIYGLAETQVKATALSATTGLPFYSFFGITK